MRLFEWLVIFAFLPAFAFSIRRKNPNRNETLLLVGGLAGVCLLQILLEGFRWQLWGLLIGSALAAAGLLSRKTVYGWISLVPAAVSIPTLVLFPIPKVEQPTGEYAVGTATVHLVDPDREEIYAETPGLDREFMVQVWYPALAGTGTPAQWMPDIDEAGPVIAGWLGLPRFMLDHLKYAGSVAEENAEPVQDEARYPLLLFSHGWTGFKEQNSAQMEELASHGYVVASINHTYGAILTVFPDGRVLPWNPDALPEDVPLEEYDIASNLLVRQWAGDMAFTIEALKTNELGLSIDFDRIGVMGHSTGGGAALEFCAFNDACDAVFAMDPWFEPASAAVRTDGIGQDAFFLFSENWEQDGIERNYGFIEELIRNSSGAITTATVAGTKHLDFSMLPLLSPLTETLGLKGPIDGDRIILIMNAMAVSYLDHVLKGEAALPESLEGFPELTFGTLPGGD